MDVVLLKSKVGDAISWNKVGEQRCDEGIYTHTTGARVELCTLPRFTWLERGRCQDLRYSVFVLRPGMKARGPGFCILQTTLISYSFVSLFGSSAENLSQCTRPLSSPSSSSPRKVKPSQARVAHSYWNDFAGSRCR